MKGQRDFSFSQKKALQFSPFLRALDDAREYAVDLRCTCWDFSVSLDDALAMGVTHNDLRWMIRKGWIACSLDEFAHEEGCPNCDSLELTNRLLQAESTFVLEQYGLEALMFVGAPRVTHEAQTEGSHPFRINLPQIKPVWDSERHELSIMRQVVKRYRWPATNQETILAAFEEESWPPRIDDPLPLSGNLEPKRRLSDTIKCLNRNQCMRLIRFRGDGTGEGILWDVASNTLAPNPV